MRSRSGQDFFEDRLVEECPSASAIVVVPRIRLEAVIPTVGDQMTIGSEETLRLKAPRAVHALQEPSQKTGVRSGSKRCGCSPCPRNRWVPHDANSASEFCGGEWPNSRICLCAASRPGRKYYGAHLPGGHPETNERKLNDALSAKVRCILPNTALILVPRNPFEDCDTTALLRASSSQLAHQHFALRAKTSRACHLNLRALRRERHRSVVGRPDRTKRGY